MRAVLRALSAFAAFAIAVLVPLRASAMIIPTCENDAVTQMPTTLNMSCDEAAEAALAEGTPAPICDPAGASAIAPPRLLPVADGRIESVPSCGVTAESGPMVGPHRGGHPALITHALLDPATLDVHLVVPPAPFLERIELPTPEGGPRAGVRRNVYHPPL